MSAQTLAVTGLVALLLAWLLGRWAANYDIRGWVLGALWRALLRRDWLLLLGDEPGKLRDADAELKRQITDKAQTIAADARRIGTARTAAKHGSLFTLAYVANLATGPLRLVGLVLLGLGAWQYLH